ncbi:MAG TPA: gluconate 2-dehydrogenase subunit 3 family protein [Bryobacteraceae bacterium]|nr:gluconate 2-dehydrogenase subunit 3 family protein [Bryobacteraceae bacterium]
MASRRNILKTFVVLPTVAAAQAPPAPHAHEQAGAPKPAAQAPTASAEPRKPKSFDENQFKLLSTLTELIIPRSDTPGAIDAGVPFLIDDAASRTPRLTESLTRGLKALDESAQKLNGSLFVQLTSNQQVDILMPLSNDPTTELGRFFKQVKDLTVDGYYSTPEGLVKELGWSGRTYLPEFKGCTHPEHKA